MIQNFFTLITLGLVLNFGGPATARLASAYI
jgi:hypothetical protein